MQKTLAQPKKRPSFLRQHYQEIVTISLLVVDVFSIVISFFIAYRLRLIIPLPEPAQGVPGFATFLPLLSVQIVSIVTAFFLKKMYHRRRTRYGSDDLAAAILRFDMTDRGLKCPLEDSYLYDWGYTYP